jgi:3beta-hydroxy-delta5-steroid dehydrogenase/steroid delta-isomerase
MNLVIGGAGFIGQAIVELLRDRGEAVRVFDLLPYPDPAVETIIGDVRNAAQVADAINGAATVYHTASFIFYGLGKPEQVLTTNVDGTRHVLDACRKHGVRKLVYSSSTEVLLGDGKGVSGDESLPYPATHISYYGETKARAEAMVLQANGDDNLLTCSLRPSGVYGENDKHQMAAMLGFIKRKRMISIGNGTARAIQGYVANVAHAHLLAADRLFPQSPVAGQAYFVGDGDTQNHFAFFAEILRAAGYDLPVQHLPLWVADGLAFLAETAWNVLPAGWVPQPLLNKYTIASTARPYDFSIEKAKRDLGYAPLVPRHEAIEHTGRCLRKLAAEQGL